MHHKQEQERRNISYVYFRTE